MWQLQGEGFKKWTSYVNGKRDARCINYVGIICATRLRAFAIVYMVSFIAGLPLSINKWWHLRVSSDKSGRGVIMLIRTSYFMSLLSVAVILFDASILLVPSQEFPEFACVLLEWSVSFLMMQRYHGGLPIALGR